MPMSVLSYDDANKREVGVEWVEDFTACSQATLPGDKNSATSFYNILGSKGWTKRFNWGNAEAYEKDYEKKSVGGWDYLPTNGNYNIYAGADTVDFAFYAGHGEPTAFWFGTPNDGDGSYTCRAHRSETSWGETDLDWIAIQSCNILQFNSPSGNVWSRWLPTFKGLHQILSYDTTEYTYNVGDRFAFWMTKSWYQWPWFAGKKNIRNAWFRANQDEQPSSVWSAVLGTAKGWNDWLPGYGSVGPDGGYLYYWQRVQS